MAISINSCFKPSLPPPPSPISSSRPILLPSSPAKEVTSSWPSRCVSAAAACVVVGSAVGFSSIGGGGGRGGSIISASDPKGVSPPAPAVAVAVRWSDKIRKCPPWRVNSLENVMPENLPRLSDRGRSDGFASYRTNAPALSGASSLGYNSRCYSL